MAFSPGGPTASCDLLVIGSGAAGLAAAVTARAMGLEVIVAEKAPVYGGTTVYSAGVVWVPANRAARAARIDDSPQRAFDYLEAEAGARLDRDKAATYVESAGEVLDWFETHTHVRCALAAAWPDYHPQQPGGLAGGRSLGPVPFDGRTLGDWFLRQRPPLATTTVFGGMMVGREDVAKFYSMTRSWRSALAVARLAARYARDRLSYPRGTRLSNGSALIGMLARSARESGVRLWLETPLRELVVEGGRVTGADLGVAGRDGKTCRVTARLGVVLATGGFPANAGLRQRHYPHVARGQGHCTLAPAANTGDGLAAAQALGVSLVEDLHQPAAWTPVSMVPQALGEPLPFPHFLDRGKAGYIAVAPSGRRFISEARSYHDFVPAMIKACGSGPAECYLICDSAALRHYGLGRAPPSPGRVAPFVRSGYLKRSETLAGLAAACGIDPVALAATVERFNTGAHRGIDAEFGKGTDVYERFNGSAGVAPNPCVAPLARPPFYAVRIIAGDIGTFIGLRTDVDGRALGADGVPVTGLYAVGNDAASFMGGTYPGAGITLGPALVFGHRAALHAAATRGA